MGKALFANSGSEANDTAVKLAWLTDLHLDFLDRDEDVVEFCGRVAATGDLSPSETIVYTYRLL